MIREKTIEKIVREFIANELTMSPEKIHSDDNLLNDLHADSMDIVNIVTAIEARFKIKFPDDSKINYEGYTMQFLVEGIKTALKEKNPVRRKVTKKVQAAKKAQADLKAKMQSHTSTTKKAEPKAPSVPKKAEPKAAKTPKKTAAKSAEPTSETTGE